MPPADQARPASYVPRRVASGTFPVGRDYHLRQMLHNYACSGGRDDDSAHPSGQEIIPLSPFRSVPVYADTVDIETLAFHSVEGCLLTPDNVAARIGTDDLRYHVWVAAKRVVESGGVQLADKEALLRAVMNQFMVELGLALLDLSPGPLVLFVDPRLHDDAEAMVAQAMAMVATFDLAHVRRWRIVITLPATEEGIGAAQVLTQRHAIQTHLTLVSCLAHAAACIDAGASMVSMSIQPMMEWFEKQHGSSTPGLSPDHPGIEAIQTCATYIHQHRLNTTLLTTDMRQWAELKQLSGIGAAALTQAQLDQIPTRSLVTWFPQPDDTSRATRLARAAPPPHSNDTVGTKGFLTTLPAQGRSLVTAVLYVRLRRMAACMAAIDKVVSNEVKRRIRLAVPVEQLYRRPSASASVRARADADNPAAGARRARPSSTSRIPKPTSRTMRADERPEYAPNGNGTGTMTEGIDYF